MSARSFLKNGLKRDGMIHAERFGGIVDDSGLMVM